MLKTFSFALVAALLMAFSATAQANPQVYGEWVSVQNFDGVRYTLALGIQETQSQLAITCEKDGQSATAQITVPTEVTDQKVIIKGSASDSKKVGDADCSVELVPMEFDYTLPSATELNLTAQGQTLAFKRL